MFLPAPLSKEAQHVFTGPPPRPAIATPQPATVVPLDQLWTRIPPTRRQELIGQLTRILARRLAPPTMREAAHE